MAPDVAAGGTGGGHGYPGVDGDLVGVGFHGDLGGLAGVDEANLDLLATDHDRPRTDTRRVTVSGSGKCGGWAVPARAPRSRDRASCGTGQAMVRARMPPDRMWATGPSSRSVTLVQAVIVRGRIGVRLRGELPGSGPSVSVTWIPHSPAGTT